MRKSKSLTCAYVLKIYFGENNIGVGNNYFINWVQPKNEKWKKKRRRFTPGWQSRHEWVPKQLGYCLFLRWTLFNGHNESRPGQLCSALISKNCSFIPNPNLDEVLRVQLLQARSGLSPKTNTIDGLTTSHQMSPSLESHQIVAAAAATWTSSIMSVSQTIPQPLDQYWRSN